MLCCILENQISLNYEYPIHWSKLKVLLHLPIEYYVKSLFIATGSIERIFQSFIFWVLHNEKCINNLFNIEFKLNLTSWFHQNVMKLFQDIPNASWNALNQALNWISHNSFGLFAGSLLWCTEIAFKYLNNFLLAMCMNLNVF